jgi:alkylhydroperoxidase family enzyme
VRAIAIAFSSESDSADVITISLQIEAYVFSPKEKSVLRFLSHAKGSMTLSNEDVNDLKAHCDEREIADILAVDSLYHMIARLDVVLRTCRQPRVVS